MNTKFALAAVLAASAGLAQAETDLSLARSYELTNAASEYDSLLSNYNASNITVSAQVQARYQVNVRDDSAGTLGDNDTTVGFSVRRAKVAVSGAVTDNIKGNISMAVRSSGTNSGTAMLEDAYADWAINDDLTIRMGQFKAQHIREENVSSKRQLASDRSVTNELYNWDRTQGIELHFGGDNWRGAVGFNDGINADNTAFSVAAEADWGANARFEMLLGDAEWSQFKQFTSWRGSTGGSMIGAGFAYASQGDTNGTVGANPEDNMTLTVDYSLVGDGWNFFAAGIMNSRDNSGATVDTDDFGIVVQGGVFVTDQDELFARWDAVFPDDSNPGGTEDFNSLTFGWNHYLVPESHAAKFTLDLRYTLDELATSLANGAQSDGINLLADADDGQIAVTAQFQFLF
jgi:hypothetical protein